MIAVQTADIKCHESSAVEQLPNNMIFYFFLGVKNTAERQKLQVYKELGLTAHTNDLAQKSKDKLLRRFYLQCKRWESSQALGSVSFICLGSLHIFSAWGSGGRQNKVYVFIISRDTTIVLSWQNLKLFFNRTNDINLDVAVKLCWISLLLRMALLVACCVHVCVRRQVTWTMQLHRLWARMKKQITKQETKNRTNVC